MKRVQAYIRLNKLEPVKDALANRGILGMSVLETRGFGRQQGQTSTFRGSTYALNLVPKVKLDIVIPDDQLNDCLEAIISAAQTGELGDGKIFVSEVTDAIRIRTGERGPDAL
jgi:nitrogen regulatory protein P-II 1